MDDKGNKASLHTKLLDFCNTGSVVEVFLSQDDEVFGTLTTEGSSQTLPLTSLAFSQRLRYLFTQETGLHVTGAGLRDVIDCLEGAAQFKKNRKEVNLRIGKIPGGQCIDLGDDSGRVIEITRDGWSVANCNSVRFWRPLGLKPLPVPARTTESLETLLAPFVSTRDRNDLIILVSWLLGAFMANGPYPVLVVQSEQGTGKSSFCDLLRRLVDPSKALSRGQPRSLDDLQVAARNSRVVVLDNLSDLPDWMSDGVCRIATGGGFGKRRMYTDGEEFTCEIQRPQVLNGIVPLTITGDLLSRVVVIHLEPISAKQRQTSEGYRIAFEKVWPSLFGAILNVLVVALRNWEDAVIGTDTRLGDWCKFMNAAEAGLGWQSGTFIRAYDENRERERLSALDADPVARRIIEHVRAHNEKVGSATDLLAWLNATCTNGEQRSEKWPRSPEAFSKILTRLIPDLRAADIEVARSRMPNSKRERIIRIRSLSGPAEQPEQGPFMLN